MGTLGDLLVQAAEVSLVEMAGDNAEPALARANLLAAVGDLAGPCCWPRPCGRAWAGGRRSGRRALLMVAYGLVLATQPLPAPSPPEDVGTRVRSRCWTVARDRRVIVAGLLVAVIVAFDDTFIGFAMAFLIADQTCRRWLRGRDGCRHDGRRGRGGVGEPNQAAGG